MKPSCMCLVGLQVLTLWSAGFAQLNRSKSKFVVNGHSGEASTVQIDGRTFVDLEAVARIGKAALTFQGEEIILQVPPALPADAATAAAQEMPVSTGLSREFMRSGIETIASLREWASTLGYAIQNGYGVTESWIADYRERAVNDLHLASSAASTDSDREALRLLTHEFEAVKDWSEKLVEAKNKMDVGKYALSPNALRDDPSSQKIIRCGHFLASMLGSGTFQDDPSCH